MRITISYKIKRIKELWEIAKPLSSQHIRKAALKLDESDGDMSSFKDSTGFDVIVDSKKYPPKAILGRALSDYYGVEDEPILWSASTTMNETGLNSDVIEVALVHSDKMKLGEPKIIQHI